MGVVDGGGLDVAGLPGISSPFLPGGLPLARLRVIDG